MAENNEDDWNIIDPETDTGSSEKQQYSYDQLIMRSMIKCMDAGSKEMREGYFNEKLDRAGNIIKIYVEDTRNVLIQSVKTLLKMMECILDDDAKKEIKEVLEKLDESYKELCLKELNEMFKAHPIIKKQRMLAGIFNREGSLNKDLQYYQDYIFQEVDTYLKIFGSLNALASREGLGRELVMNA